MEVFNKIRYYIAMFVARIVYLLMRLIGKRASHMPGAIANVVCPNFLKYVKKPKITIGVTGTNGKTTTCNILNDFFTLQGMKVLNNKAGSNIRAGISTAFIASFRKKDIAVLEVDERSSYQTLPFIKLDYLICTNLFRDSVKRNANPEYIFSILNPSIPKETTLILNADDLFSHRLGLNNKKIYYGIAKMPTDHDDVYNIISDVPYCPICHSNLKFNYVKYHHMANAKCTKCSFKSPKANYLITEINLEKNNITMLKNKYYLLSHSMYNIYNETAVIALLHELGYKYKKINDTFKKMKLTEIRVKEKAVSGIDIKSIVVKGQNPVACSQNFNYVRSVPGKKEVIVMLDDIYDNGESSENINWFYDSDFELLNDDNILRVIVGGPRAYDAYLRFRMAGIDKKKLFYDLNELNTCNYLSYKDAEKVFILHDLYNGKFSDEIYAKIIKKYEGLK